VPDAAATPPAPHFVVSFICEESIENRHPPSSLLHRVATHPRWPLGARQNLLKSPPPPPFLVISFLGHPGSPFFCFEPQIGHPNLSPSRRDRLDPR
jgi:hypothetical protein